MVQRGPITRPSPRELDSKLKEAKRCVAAKANFFVDEKKMTSDLNELGIGKPSEIWPLIEISLNEISRQDYIGTYPPSKSYEEAVEGVDCWQFNWSSSHFGKRMFLRFMLKNGYYFHSSLHESRWESTK